MQFRKKKSKVESDTKQKKYGENRLDESIDSNIKLFKQIFIDDGTFTVRYFENQHNEKIKCCIFYIEGMVDNTIVNENIIKPVIMSTILKDSDETVECLKSKVIVSDNVTKAADIDELAAAVIRGETVLVLDGSSNGLIIHTKGWQTRSITEPQGERVARGPREGFIEAIMVNLTMIRRKLETTDLSMKFMTIGKQTQTKICICYMDGIVNQKVLAEIYRRLNEIQIDGILDSGYITELIRDSPYSPLGTIGTTERPDTFAAKLLEGRIGIVVDGTPVALTIPFVFIENFQSNEDYYNNFYFSSINRILRILSFFITISVPGIYSALVTFHQEAIPTPLILSISAAREGVPFPTIVEIIILLTVYEILRETGLRMPYYIGQALSIVGAMVLGTAAVEARLVSAPIVIVVSITAITGLMLPGIKGTVILLRLLLLLLSALLGLYGYIFGMMGFLIYLCELRSFGVPYMLSLMTLDPDELGDTVIRAPWWHMRLRPKLLTNNRIRQLDGVKKR